MKIIIFNHNGGSIYHGPNLRTYYAAKELVKLGHSVTIVSSSYSHKYGVLPKIKGLITEEVIDGITYKWIKCIKYTNLFQRIYSHFEYGFKIVKNKQKLYSNADVIIFSGPPPEIFLYAHKLAKQDNIPIVSDIRDLWPLTQIEMNKLQWLNPYVYFLYFAQYFLVKKSNYLLSPLAGSKKYFQKIDRDVKVEIIENGFDLNNLKKSEDELVLNVLASSKNLNIKNTITSKDLKSLKKFIVGYSGSFDRDNDIDSLIEVAKQNKSTNIIFLFVGNGKRVDFLKGITKDIKNVIVCDRVPSKIVPKVLNNMDICYCGLKKKDIYQYGVSLAKTYEYMACAKPIIWMIEAFNNPIKDAKCGFSVEPENVKELAKVIEKASKMDKKDLEQLGKNGYGYLKNNYAYDVLGKKWENLIKKVINNAK